MQRIYIKVKEKWSRHMKKHTSGESRARTWIEGPTSQLKPTRGANHLGTDQGAYLVASHQRRWRKEVYLVRLN
jgi:uncharacterized protein (DUF2384 family)